MIEPDDTGRSTLIGVGISLTGNVLISLALNCQKLAHIRMQECSDGPQNTGSEINGTSNGHMPPRQKSAAATELDGLLHGNRSCSNSQTYGATSSTEEVAQQSPSSSSSVTNKHRRHGSRSSDLGHESSRTGLHKQGNNTDTGPGSEFRTDFLKSRFWWLGIGLMTLGEFGNFLSYGFAPASLVAPLGAIALLANVVFSPILLKERFRLSDLGGMLLAIIGAVTVVFSSKQSDVSFDPDELWEAVRRREFIAYTGIVVSLLAVLSWASSTRLGDQYILLDVGVCALFGGFTVLSTKGLSSLVSQMGPFELLRFPIAYGLVVVLVGTALAQITFLNRALQRFDSREVIPTQFVMFTISAIVGSAILYQDFKDTDVHQVINFLFGCATTFLGVFFLTKSDGDDDEEEQDDEEASVQGVGETFAEYTSADTLLEDTHAPLRGTPAAANGPDATATPTVVRKGQPGESSHAAVPVSMPPSRTANRRAGLFGPSPRRHRHYAAALSTSTVPTLAALRPAPQRGITTAAVPTDASLLASTSFQEARSVPVLYTRRSIFNPAFSITYVDPTFARAGAAQSSGAPAAAAASTSTQPLNDASAPSSLPGR